MTSEKENTPRSKKPYSPPSLTAHSLVALAMGAAGSSAAEGPATAIRPSLPGFQPPPLVIDGFPGNVEDLVQVLSSIQLRSPRRLDPEAASTQTAQGKSASGRIHTLLVDMRCRVPGTRQVLTRLELDADLSAVLILVLTDERVGFAAGAEIRRGDRWHFRGSTASEDLAVLVKSLFQPPAARAQAQ